MKKTILIPAAVSVCMMLTACGKTVYYTADDFVDVSVSGINGKGTASVDFDKSNLLGKINNDLYNGKADDMELAKAEVGLYQYVQYDILDDNTENLSNGDTIAIKVTADNEALSEFGYGVDENNSVFVYTVEGLIEPTVIDLFKDIEINVTGISPYLSADAEYTGNDQFIKDNVHYTVNTGGYLANGDTVTVKASVNINVLEENNYIAEITEKEFELSGYDKYADADSDLTSAAEFLDEYAHSFFEEEGKTYSLNWEHNAMAFFKDGSSSELWKVIEEDITPVKAVIYSNDSSWSSTYNSYNIFYKINMTVEKTGTNVFSPNTGYEVGDKEDSEIFFCVALKNIVEKTDGTLEYSESDTDIITYSRSLFGNYVGADIIKVSNARDSEMIGFKSEELEVIVN